MNLDPRKGLPSASNAWRRRNCPASRNAKSVLEKEEPSDIAEEGTLIHKALETRDLSKLTDEQSSIATTLIGMIDDAYGAWVNDIPEANRKNIKEYREARFWVVHPETGEEMESAQIDVGYVCGDRALIIDGKTGFLTATPSPKNYQLRVQALAVWNTFPRLKEITVAIAQHRFKSNYNSCVYTKADILFCQQEFLLADWISKQPDAAYSAGEWCRWCPAKSNCKTATTYAMVSQQTVPLVSTDPDEILARVNALDPADLAYVHKHASIGRKIFDAVALRMKAMPVEELRAIGWDLSKPAEVATITNIKRAKKILVTGKKWLTTKEFESALKLPLGAVETPAAGIISKREDVSVKEAKRIFRKTLKPVITVTPKAPTLIPYVPEQPQIAQQ